MPPVKLWPNFNGYKVFYEFGMKLKKVLPVWVKEDISNKEAPKIESLYDIIKEYNSKRAEEYKVLFNKCYGDIL